MGRGAVGWGLGVLVLVGGCRANTGTDLVGDAAGPVGVSQRPGATKTPPIWAALIRPCGAVLGNIGPYRLSARSRLERSGKGLAPEAVEQRVELRGDGQGHYAARKTTHPQYGSEVIWDGRWIYSRLRYNPFTRRAAEDSKEPRRILERFCGLLPAYLRLLAPSMVVRVLAKPAGRPGRAVKRIVLRIREHPAVRHPGVAVARRWRATVKVEHLDGELDWDEDEQIPLHVRIQARWMFTPPAKPEPETGIPRELGMAGAGRMSLDFEQRIERLGAEQHIAAPPDDQVITRVRRLRLEIERQMAVGERPIERRPVDRAGSHGKIRPGGTHGWSKSPR